MFVKVTNASEGFEKLCIFEVLDIQFSICSKHLSAFDKFPFLIESPLFSSKSMHSVFLQLNLNNEMSKFEGGDSGSIAEKRWFIDSFRCSWIYLLSWFPKENYSSEI